MPQAIVTSEELANVFATKTGFKADTIDIFREGGGWSASLKGPNWTPQRNAQIKQLARALAPHFRLADHAATSAA